MMMTKEAVMSLREKVLGKEVKRIYLPMMTYTENGKVIMEFDGFDEFYSWAKANDNKLLANVLASAKMIYCFGMRPFRYDGMERKVYVSEGPYIEGVVWKEI